jgi:hypothetical protein
MATAEDILRRMADDPVFALAVRTDPVTALRGIAISAAELRRIEEVLDAVHGPSTSA